MHKIFDLGRLARAILYNNEGDSCNEINIKWDLRWVLCLWLIVANNQFPTSSLDDQGARLLCSCLLLLWPLFIFSVMENWENWAQTRKYLWTRVQSWEYYFFRGHRSLYSDFVYTTMISSQTLWTVRRDNILCPKKCCLLKWDALDIRNCRGGKILFPRLFRFAELSFGKSAKHKKYRLLSDSPPSFCLCNNNGAANHCYGGGKEKICTKNRLKSRAELSAS